jgi:hypothetical protein
LGLLIRRHPATPLLFREQALYFGETAVNWNQNSADTETVEKKLKKDLLLALESARTRLAIAIASEKKCTLPARWQYFLDTADKMGLSIKDLRKTEADAFTLGSWISALEMLKKIPAHEQAYQFCRNLRDVVSEIEQGAEKRKTAAAKSFQGCIY